MDEVTLGHEIVCLDGTLDVVPVDADGDAHEHVLWALGNLAIDAEEVRALESLEAEVLVVEVTLIDDGGVKHVGIVAHDLVRLLRNHAGWLAVLRVY